ncbi:MAG: hypothetical protein OEW78_07190 [Nitrosopumilus sp.]|uniref:hypothetical protein n=1 Tax=Nitrosopumilus sp. TaxID=2024843 RepID=UPI0024717834|nr:hypothetical protein [Nitrosopumilus sp.]MDH5431649.1 hypothetical protein [Nitrosopumilus sp.]
MMLILVWAIIMTITLGILVVVLLNLKKKHDVDIQNKENEIQDMNQKLEQKQTKSYRAGVNVTSGDYSQILGEFALLSKYDSIITLSTTSRQPSLDLIGINDESLDFLELKKKGAGSTNSEQRVRKLIEEKKVAYKIFDVDLPNNFSVKERKLKEIKTKENKPKSNQVLNKKPNLQKIESQKVNPEAYEPWTKENDESLKSYWSDKSNKLSEDEKIQELCEKLGRNKGGIKSRLKKLGLS